MIDKIKEVRSTLRKVKSGTDSPQLARCVHLADMNLHWALWSLGEIEELAPELE